MRTRWINVGIIGLLIIITLHGMWVLYDYEQVYPEDKVDKKIILVGTVASLIDQDKSVSKFLFATNDGLVQLSVYPNKNLKSWRLTPGTRWRFTVKLQYPEGYSNPGVFSYVTWLKHQGIKAVGYVVTTENVQFHGMDYNYLIERLRYNIQKTLNHHIKDISIRALASALLIGNRNELTTEDKRVFQQTGTSHLIAISGLHIGMIALFAFVFVRVLWSLSIVLCQWLPAQKVALVAAVVSAFLYSLLAGFAIPTQRAFIMVLIFSLALMTNRKINGFNVLIIAAIIIVLWNPLSILAPGFWLSFMAVFFLIIINRLLLYMPKFKRYVLIQFLLMLLLIPLTVYWFQGFTLIGVVANLVAIPLVSFLIVPSLFLNLMLSFFGITLWSISAYLIKALIVWLDVLPTYMLFFSWHSISLLAVLAAIMGMLILFLPLSWYFRVLGLTLFLALWQKNTLPFDVGAKVTVLDVGHGLAVVIQTKNAVVVYDTAGAGGHKFVLANHTLIPYLKNQGVHTINALIISHLGKDHSGGIENVLASFNVDQVIANEKLSEINNSICTAGKRWLQDGVVFEFLTANHLTGNNGSCVLKISFDDKSMLLTGDIYKTAERYILKQYHNQLKSIVLVAPHHGSGSSSSKAFIEAVGPKYVIFSSSGHDGFKHPHNEVVQAYLNIGAKILNTAQNGAITAIFKDNGELEIETEK